MVLFSLTGWSYICFRVSFKTSNLVLETAQLTISDLETTNIAIIKEIHIVLKGILLQIVDLCLPKTAEKKGQDINLVYIQVSKI